jgi:hypothetical protein
MTGAKPPRNRIQPDAAEEAINPPPSTPVFLVSWAGLEMGLNLLANPDRADQVQTVVSALRRLQPSAPADKLLVQILGATAWLTSDEPLEPSVAGEASMT